VSRSVSQPTSLLTLHRNLKEGNHLPGIKDPQESFRDEKEEYEKGQEGCDLEVE
jgi:hypothetical protein